MSKGKRKSEPTAGAAALTMVGGSLGLIVFMWVVIWVIRGLVAIAHMFMGGGVQL
jgi:hypothetical protein